MKKQFQKMVDAIKKTAQDKENARAWHVESVVRNSKGHLQGEGRFPSSFIDHRNSHGMSQAGFSALYIKHVKLLPHSQPL